MSPDPKDSITPTPRERELMMLIARGLQNKNIAYELKISENTVRAHIGNIMRKYRLQNRTQIAIIYALKTAPLSLRRDLTRNGTAPAAVKPPQALAQNPRLPTAPE
ncbi:helix-turn-helix transcriptional regulator [Bradyrhizobium sacchari]|uniref:Regulatory LuxR family protein n=1 Tax=Bradyrhizobium sacchari TaxID=1399419 RepID=A0A560K5W8_9BRAD|nr:LuxR C-terminal-related transcriptional regulator [Bradyrhizobium sacchari]OPY97380.1 helix-turn-helix transcriptional regulator [Bradyrhizobium sacchari]TWB56008.1 regulatory LuxR family protein [Bradyrhizobium sacchari]TWB78682.1 regulatory LuxR family protein [Bradyrhizobium sacchari]